MGYEEQWENEDKYGINIRILSPHGTHTTNWGYYSIKSDGSVYKMEISTGEYKLIS